MEVSRNWRLQKQRYGLVGEICNYCGEKIFPPRDVCPNCAEGLMVQAVSKLSTIGQSSVPVVLLESK